ncbi:MAG: hypothetical protein JO332_15035 [Planctomycetaceae bacterium]|nr:hypothetical protein [Planctomycetaceae bacterium]
MTPLLLPLLLGLAGLAQEPPAPDETGIRMDLRGWLVEPGGWVEITRGSRPGTATRTRLGSEIELDRELVPDLRARWEFLDRHAVGVGVALLDLSGTRIADDGFVYHGETFDAGRKVVADMDLTLVPFDYQYAFYRTPTLGLTGHAGAEYWSYAGHLRTADGLPPLDTKRRFDSAFWMAGLDGAWSPAAWVDFRALAAGGTERQNQYFYNLEATAVLRPWANVAFSLGYRANVLRFRQSTNASDLRFRGPEIGVEIRF